MSTVESLPYTLTRAYCRDRYSTGDIILFNLQVCLDKINGGNIDVDLEGLRCSEMMKLDAAFVMVVIGTVLYFTHDILRFVANFISSCLLILNEEL